MIDSEAKKFRRLPPWRRAFEPHSGSPAIVFGTIFVMVAIGAFIPVAVRGETVVTANSDRGRARKVRPGAAHLGEDRKANAGHR